MASTEEQFSENGLQVTDLKNNSAFQARRLRSHAGASSIEAMRRLASAFLERPDTILQVLVNLAVELCGADSAGISVRRDDATEERFYHWIATAGVYSPFLDACLPRNPSACTICLERDGPQQFRVSKRFFDIIGVEAALVADGLLLPWTVEKTRGTIFIISHTRPEAFDSQDLGIMQVLADFAAMGVRHERQQEGLMRQAAAAATAAMVNELAHEINNLLQSLTNLLYLAEQNPGGGDERALARKMKSDFNRLSTLARQLLRLPGSETSQTPLSF